MEVRRLSVRTLALFKFSCLGSVRNYGKYLRDASDGSRPFASGRKVWLNASLRKFFSQGCFALMKLSVV